MPTAEEIRDVERQRLCSLVSGDMRTAQTLHADDYQLFSPNGETWSKREYLGAIATGQLDYEVFEPISPIAVRLSPDSAVIRYRVRIKFRGRRESISCWHTDSTSCMTDVGRPCGHKPLRSKPSSDVRSRT